MDNPSPDYHRPAERLQAVEELPREEVLARLYELVARFEERSGRNLCPVAAALGEPSHAFRYGCCRDARAERRAARQLERVA